MDTMNSMPPAYFVFSTHLYLLFRPWYVTNGWQYTLVIAAVFVFAMLYESLKAAQVALATAEQQLAKSEAAGDVEGGESQPLLPRVLNGTFRFRRNALHVVRAILHAVQVICSYFLMVIVMTFNAGLLLAVVCGAAVGYYLFLSPKQQNCNIGNLATPVSPEEDASPNPLLSSGAACH